MFKFHALSRLFRSSLSHRSQIRLSASSYYQRERSNAFVDKLNSQIGNDTFLVLPSGNIAIKK